MRPSIARLTRSVALLGFVGLAACAYEDGRPIHRDDALGEALNHSPTPFRPVESVPVKATAPSMPSPEAPAMSAEGVATPGITPLSSNARSAYEQNSIDVFRAMAPSVVFVTNKQLRRNAWTMETAEVDAGSGTGFIWDKRGHIVTNYHVINQGNSIEVKLFGGQTLPAKVVGGDPNKDIAVLKITPPAKGLLPVRLPRDSNPVEVGQKAVAIGNPFGFDHTLTVGVISATGRDNKGFGNVTIRGMLQTDAAINPGNSGGPLLDSQGQLIGMNTQIASTSGASAGIGFAVPVSAIRDAVPEIIKYGKVKRAGMGVELIPDAKARQNGIEGVVIADVKRGSPAARAGLRGLRRTRGGYLIGDVIVGVNGKKVKSYDDLYSVFDRLAPGDEATLSVQRRGEIRTLKVTLTEI